MIYLNGYDLRKLPLIERKALLKKLIEKTAIQFSESFEVGGPKKFKHACGIALRASSPRSGIADTVQAAAMTGSRRPALSEKYAANCRIFDEGKQVRRVR
jgi:hypothetical protein